MNNRTLLDNFLKRGDVSRGKDEIERVQIREETTRTSQELFTGTQIPTGDLPSYRVL